MKGCDQCQAMMINGVFCHETGCPNKNYRPKVRKPKPVSPFIKTGYGEYTHKDSTAINKGILHADDAKQN